MPVPKEIIMVQLKNPLCKKLSEELIVHRLQSSVVFVLLAQMRIIECLYGGEKKKKKKKQKKKIFGSQKWTPIKSLANTLERITVRISLES
jgi:hypothetical protein